MKTLWGTLLAIGTMLPGIAQAQDVDQRPGRERPEKAGDPRIDWQNKHARADTGEQAPIARPDRVDGRGREDRAQPAIQPPLQQAPRSADNGAWRGQQRGDDRRGGDATRELTRDRGGNRGEEIFQPRPDSIRDDRADGRLGNDRRGDGDRRDRLTIGLGTDVGRGEGRADRGGFGRDDRRQFDRSQFDRGRQFDGGAGRHDYARNYPRDADRFDDRRAWNRGWRNDARYDWSRNRATDRSAYRLPRYYAPGGWGQGYRRFSVGVTLFSGLFGQNYWIDDPWTYRLPDAYGPYRWVRYYDDALLVDVRTGRVVDTVYDIFG